MIRYNQRKRDKPIVFSFWRTMQMGRAIKPCLGWLESTNRRQGVWRFWRLKDEMEKLVERQRKADQRHAGGAGDCLEGGSWMLTLEAHSIERVGWIQLRRSNAQITRNPKENRTA